MLPHEEKEIIEELTWSLESTNLPPDITKAVVVAVDAALRRVKNRRVVVAK